MTTRQLLAAALLGTLALAGCGRGDSGEPVAAMTAQGTTEAAIDARVEAA